MSLRMFHLLFILASVLLTLLLGWWALGEYSRSRDVRYALGGWAAFALAAGLAVYAVTFQRKTRHLSD